MKRYSHRKKTAILLVLGMSSVAAMGGMVSSQADDPGDEAIDPPHTPDDPVLGHEVIDVEGQVAGAAVSEERQHKKKKKQFKLASRGGSEAPAATEDKKVAAAQEVLHPVDDLSRYEAVDVLATGYTAGVESTGKSKSHPAYGITKSGVQVHRGIYSTVAADPDVFPIGSVLYIPDYGYGVVADTGAAIKGKRLDLYFKTVREVYDKWGKRNITVYIIEKGDGKLTQKQFEKYNRTAEANGLATP